MLIFASSLVVAVMDPSNGGAAGLEQGQGIRFEAFLSVKAEPKVGQSPGGKPVADLSITVYVSAHSLESSFTGDVVTKFDHVDPTKDGDQRLFWSDKVCHQDRGYPRLDVRQVQGALDWGAGSQTIYSSVRAIGKPIPQDEIYAANRPLTQMSSEQKDSIPLGRSFFFKTRQSHLWIEIRLTKTNC